MISIASAAAKRSGVTPEDIREELRRYREQQAEKRSRGKFSSQPTDLE